MGFGCIAIFMIMKMNSSENTKEVHVDSYDRRKDSIDYHSRTIDALNAQTAAINSQRERPPQQAVCQQKSGGIGRAMATGAAAGVGVGAGCAATSSLLGAIFG